MLLVVGMVLFDGHSGALSWPLFSYFSWFLHRLASVSVKYSSPIISSYVVAILLLTFVSSNPLSFL